MKKTIFTIACFFIALMNLNTLQAQSNVGIGTATPEASAKLDVNSTTQGFLPPRMTEAQRDSILSPAAGLIVYCTDCGTLDYYNGSEWQALAPLNPPFQGTQQGAVIAGEAAGDASGEAISISDDGLRLAIGARQNGSFGHVRVYQWNGTNWLQMGADIEDTAPAGLNQFGAAIALSGNGNRLIVGAYLNNNASGTQSGHTQIFDWTGTAWIQVGNTINGTTASSNSGSSVAINNNGSRIMIGTPYNTGFTNSPGAVQVYDLVGSTWTQVGQTLFGEAAFNNFGRGHGTIDMNDQGTRIILGASQNSGAASQAGHARIFELVGSSWVQLGSDLDGGAASDRFGSAVSMNAAGNRVAIGAPQQENGGLTDAGAVHVYEWSGTTWIPVGGVIFGVYAEDRFGGSVSLSSAGDAVAVGAPAQSNAFPPLSVPLITKAYYYKFNVSWVAEAAFFEQAAGDKFGVSVALSGDSKTMAVGASSSDINGSNSGSVQVFR